jgi:hypothetical protein
VLVVLPGALSAAQELNVSARPVGAGHLVVLTGPATGAADDDQPSLRNADRRAASSDVHPSGGTTCDQAPANAKR